MKKDDRISLRVNPEQKKVLLDLSKKYSISINEMLVNNSLYHKHELKSNELLNRVISEGKELKKYTQFLKKKYGPGWETELSQNLVDTIEDNAS